MTVTDAGDGMAQVVTVYTTTESEEEALRLARALVDERLAACVNILPRGRSVFRWEGEVADEPETYLLIKTAGTCLAALKARIVALHSYDVPCIGVWPWQDGHGPFIDWVAEEVSGDGEAG